LETKREVEKNERKKRNPFQPLFLHYYFPLSCILNLRTLARRIREESKKKKKREKKKERSHYVPKTSRSLLSPSSPLPSRIGILTVFGSKQERERERGKKGGKKISIPSYL